MVRYDGGVVGVFLMTEVCSWLRLIPVGRREGPCVTAFHVSSHHCLGRHLHAIYFATAYAALRIMLTWSSKLLENRRSTILISLNASPRTFFPAYPFVYLSISLVNPRCRHSTTGSLL